MITRKTVLKFGLCLAFTVLLPGLAEAASIQLPVPRATIHPGEEITGLKVIERRFPVRTTQQFSVVSHRNDLIGKVARRTLLPGKPIPVNSVEIQQLVKRGEPGRLVFREQGLFIVMQVEVMQSGGAGDMVRVRNIDSGVVVSGRVQQDGSIRAAN